MAHWLGEKENIKISGYKVDGVGKRMMLEEFVGQDCFVPHPCSYYKEITRKIKEVLIRGSEVIGNQSRELAKNDF